MKNKNKQTHIFYLMRLFYCIIFSLIFPFFLLAEEKIFLFEGFENLSNWRHIEFEEDKYSTSYSTMKDRENWVLKTESSSSASGIMNTKLFNPYEYSFLSWSWKVRNVYKKGNVLKKESSDLPLSVYVVFQYDPEKASTWEKIKYNTMKFIYGEYPPYKALSYAWSNKNLPSVGLRNPYTDRIALFLLEKGELNLQKWLKEEVNFLEDYRAAFGEDPPALAAIGIMNDSDDTKEKAVSYLDNLKIFKK